MFQKRVCLIILFCMIFMSIEPSLSLADEVTTGGAVFFGHYEQDGLIDSAEEPIEWIVLSIDKSSDKVLIVSKYLLDCRVYNTSTKETAWGNSSIRNWLNSNFYDSAFTQEEKQAVLPTRISNSSDYVFLLNSEQIKKLLPSEICYATPYAKRQGVYVADDTGTSSWWVQKNTTSTNGVFVGAHGKIYEKGNKVTVTDNGIRPAMYLSLTKLTEISSEKLLGNTPTNKQITSNDDPEYDSATGKASIDSGTNNRSSDKNGESIIPFYVTSEINLMEATKDINSIFGQSERINIRTDSDALEYYLTEGGSLGDEGYVVFSNNDIALIRKRFHVVVCNFVSQNTVKPSAILMDVMSTSYARYHDEFFFAFGDGFIIVDEASWEQYNYSVKYYDLKTKSLSFFGATSFVASLDESMYIFTDTRGRIVYFDTNNNTCGVLQTNDQITNIVYSGYSNSMIVQSKQGKYVFIDYLSKQAYDTSLPNTTIYADEYVFVTNDEFSLKTHSSSSTDTLIKKSSHYKLQSSDAWYQQYGNILALPNETVYTFLNGKSYLVEKSSQLIYELDRVHRLTPKNGGINSYYPQYYDKNTASFKNISVLPQSFKTESLYSSGSWELFCSAGSLLFTPTASLANNFYLLERMGYYVYNVDNQNYKYVTIKIN